MTGLEVLRDRSTASDAQRAGAPADLDAVPAIVTRSVAEAARAEVGSTLSLTVAGRQLPLTVVGVVDRCPPPASPTGPSSSTCPRCSPWGTVAHRRPAPSSPRSGGSTRCPCPRVRDAVRTRLPAGVTVAVRTDLVAERSANPVNAGMRAAMLLVTGAALVLAAVGFAATTAALGRTRRRENAVLLALGMPPGRIRRVLALERVGVVVLTVAVGLVLGVLSALAVVPVLVGGDGHPQVPRVLVTLPARSARRLRGRRRAGAVARGGARPAQLGPRHLGRAAPWGGIVTGRHVAPASGAGRRPLGRLGLLRHSLVAERATAVLLAALTVVTTVFLVAVPRVRVGRARPGPRRRGAHRRPGRARPGAAADDERRSRLAGLGHADRGPERHPSPRSTRPCAPRWVRRCRACSAGGSSPRRATR